MTESSSPEWGPRMNLRYRDAEPKQHGKCPSIMPWRNHAWINFLLFSDEGGEWWRPAHFDGDTGIVRYLSPRVRSGAMCHRINLEDKRRVQLRVLTREIEERRKSA